MVVFPNAKINLGLSIISKRKDSFHNIASVFYPVLFQDILEIVPSNKLHFVATGLSIKGKAEDNLILKAYHLLKEDYKLPPVRIHLHKRIPMGAGLGGGSADAAFTIKSLNTLFNLGLSIEKMQQYASQIGSDCPFFIKNKVVLAEGTGNIFSNIALNLKGKYLILVCPDIHVNTAEAYSNVVPKHPKKSARFIIENIPPDEWKDCLKNDFEASVFDLYPELKHIKTQMYTAGAYYASMSGSGSCVYGIFESKPEDLPFTVSWQGVLD